MDAPCRLVRAVQAALLGTCLPRRGDFHMEAPDATSQGYPILNALQQFAA
jgi:hypothetical protein